MNSDFTQQQSLGGLEKAEQLSRQSGTPPAELDGYQLEKILGQGAFGQVWLGQDLNTRRKVAIKFYSSRSSVNLSLINREVGHLVSMSTGSGIVQVLKVGWDAEPPYYIMEYLENGSLDDLIHESGVIEGREATRLFLEIAQSLSYAHSKGVLHCDLKPANVMLDHDLKPRLADFGQSRLSDEQTPSLGTLFYMAPEQADLQATPDAAWDVYALGAIAYTMLVGSPPHRTQEFLAELDKAQSLQERLTLYRTSITVAPPLKQHYQVAGADKQLCQIIDRCLAPRAEDRYSNVQQVVSDLQHRESSRSRRPLLLLGIVAPILFLLLMLFFSARSIGVAKQESIQSVQQWSVRSNQFAAQLAAQSLESEFAALYRLVEAEARRPELVDAMSELQTSQRVLLTNLRRTTEAAKQETLIAELKQSAAQVALSAYLQHRIAEMIQEDSERRSIFNSMFVNGPDGTNLGIHFVASNEDLSQSPVGRNFAYRTYFNGLAHDGSSTADPSTFRPIRRTHLSSVFKSTSTGKLKVGISTPVLDQNKIVGVLVLTINLGHFELLSGLKYDEQLKADERFASLVDARQGNRQGTLLQHPYLKWLESSSPPESWPDTPQIDIRILDELKSRGAIVNYQDPAAELDGGQKFVGTWIASIQEVPLPRSRQFLADSESEELRATGPEKRPSSNLWVLVQEKGSSVAQPVEALGSRLQRETIVEFLSLLCVLVILWIVVIRFGTADFRPTRAG